MRAPAPDRRAFLHMVGRCAGGACLAWIVGDPLAALASDPPVRATCEVPYYERLAGGRIRCGVCPHHCVLADGERGLCRARRNVGGRHVNTAYNNPCLLNVDPIEKLPLNHFRPGSRTMTIAVGGCNLRCLYCQNWQHSQTSPTELETFPLSAADAVRTARRHQVDTIGFSYTEPVAFLEYATEVAAAARRARLRVVVATAGYVEPEPLLKLAAHVDAFAITLKAFDNEGYERLAGVRLAPVLRTIEQIRAKTRCWLEIVNLIVPTFNDDVESIGCMANWVREHAGEDTPLHFERFVPLYQLANLPRTSVPTLEAACRAARAAGLRYVYTSNIAPHEATNTFCAACGERVIQRLGFKILEDRLRRGVCPQCRQRLPGVWS